MPATVIPRNTSSDRSRSRVGDGVTALPSEADLEMAEEEEQADDDERRQYERSQKERAEELRVVLQVHVEHHDDGELDRREEKQHGDEQLRRGERRDVVDPHLERGDEHQDERDPLV